MICQAGTDGCHVCLLLPSALCERASPDACALSYCYNLCGRRVGLFICQPTACSFFWKGRPHDGATDLTAGAAWWQQSDLL